VLVAATSVVGDSAADLLAAEDVYGVILQHLGVE
jgi:hypothetical protein